MKSRPTLVHSAVNCWASQPYICSPWLSNSIMALRQTWGVFTVTMREPWDALASTAEESHQVLNMEIYYARSAIPRIYYRMFSPIATFTATRTGLNVGTK